MVAKVTAIGTRPDFVFEAGANAAGLDGFRSEATATAMVVAGFNAVEPELAREEGRFTRVAFRRGGI